MALGLAQLSAIALCDGSLARGTAADGPRSEALTELVEELREERDLVSLAAMVMIDGKVVGAGADGERVKGSGVPVEVGDRWHLGSITKSITATMIGRLIEAGKMDWSDTVGDCFGNDAVDEGWRGVTLRQLLTHTAGAPDNFPRSVRTDRPPIGVESARARRRAVMDVLAEPPEYAPGSRRLYSNVGYTIAGAMAEKRTRKPWSELVERGVFKPLRLSGAGFGPPKSRGNPVPQPQGHRSSGGRKSPMGDQIDNTSIMGPAGTVHMTLRDLCTYANDHLRGELGQDGLLKAATYQELHRPELEDYACGWSRLVPDPEAGLEVYSHNGSNTLWYALVVFVPLEATVVAVASNDGDIDSAEAAAWQIALAQAAANAAERASWQEDDDDAIDPTQLVGRYQLARDFVFDVNYEDGRMMVGITNQPTQEVFADSPTRWSYRSVEAALEFHVRAGRPAHALTLHQNGAAQRAKRIRSVDPQRLVGRYELNPNFIFDVNYSDGRMMVGITNQPTQEVFADSPTRWSYRSVEAALEFHVRRRGPAHALTLHQNGIEQRARRIRED